MSNKEKIGWCAGVILLVILYLLSSTDLIIKEKKKEIFRVSVIVDQVNDNYYGNFREGMNMAEKKYQADVNFITLYAENDEKQQDEPHRARSEGRNERDHPRTGAGGPRGHAAGRDFSGMSGDLSRRFDDQQFG